MPPPRIVLFDLDGALAETENLHVGAWEQVFERMGLDVPLDLCHRAATLDDEALLVEVLDRLKLREADAAGWVRAKREVAGRLFAETLKLDADAAEVVRRLAGRARLGVVATARAADVRALLAREGLLDAFEVVAAGADMMAGVTTYRHALNELGEPAVGALAVVANEVGLAAAGESGLRTLLVGRGETGRVDLRDVGAVVDAIEGFR